MQTLETPMKRLRPVLLGGLVYFAAAGVSPAKSYDPPRTDLPLAVQDHIDMAYLLWNGEVSKDFLTMLLYGNVNPSSGGPAPLTIYAAHKQVTPPVKAFDQLVYLGMNTVGSWALKTSKG